LVENALGKLTVVVASMIEIHRQTALVFLKHQNDVRPVATRMRIA
jgi:hypothetical protein